MPPPSAPRVVVVDDVTGLPLQGGGSSGAPSVDTELPAAAALTNADPNPTTPTVGAALMGFNGGTQWGRVTAFTPQDGLGGSTALGVNSIGQVWNPTATVNTERIRTPNTWKTLAAVAVVAGVPAAAWTPTSGKKFRIMGYALSLSVAGSVILFDAAAEMIRTPLMAAGVGQNGPQMGNGKLSAAANNVLNVDVTATGTVSGFVFGTEE